MEISKDLIIRYLNARCNSEEEEAVGRWLVHSEENTRLAMRWVDELTDQQEKTLLKMVLSSDKVWKEIISKLKDRPVFEEENVKIEPRTSVLVKVFRFLKRYAAIWVSVLMLGFAYYLYHKSKTVEVATAFGETRVISLPDGSKVTLNGNSSIRYAYGWTGAERLVWLKGEAFFHVKPLATNATFKVYFADEREIEVTGTEFNIDDGNEYSEVVLQSGKIRLHLNGEKTKGNTVYLLPGEMGEIHQQQIRIRRVDPEIYSAWVEGKWQLKETTLQRVLEKLKLRYGISVVVTDEKLLARRASGSIALRGQDASMVLTGLSRLFNLKVFEKGDEIMLTE